MKSLTQIVMVLNGLHTIAAFSSIGRRVFSQKVSSISTKNAAFLSQATNLLTQTNPIAYTKDWSPSSHRTFGLSTSLGMGAEKTDKLTSWTFDEPCDIMGMNSMPTTTLSFSDESKLEDDTDLIILGVFAPPESDDKDDDSTSEKDEKDKTVEPMLVGRVKELDEDFSGAITELMMDNYEAFKNGAKAGSLTPTLRSIIPGSKTKRFTVLGLGEEGKDIDDGYFAKLGREIALRCDAEKKISKCTIVLPSGITLQDKSLFDVSTEFYSTLYSDNRYRNGDKVEKKVEDLLSVTIIADGGVEDLSAANDALASGKLMAEGVSLSKDIVNAPHNILNSESMANLARQIAADSDGTMTCKVLGKEECEARGMGAFLGVARGSETDPRFIHLTYTPKSGKASKKIGIVGKGLLFDTGGYNIKVAGMELMKFDCGGSAAVFGAAKAIGALAPDNIEAHFFVAACENMINEKAMVPSDILTASNGKTIEIINTDAEGRLTLADALVYADEEVGCDSIIELSTLTGACMVSLGLNICGVWTADDELAAELAQVSKVTGEKSWRMPLEEEYNDQLKSKIADISNCGTRYGGAITAALFLQNFVSEKVPFAHIDIAGPVWDDKLGATGFGAKMVTEWICMKGKKE